MSYEPAFPSQELNASGMPTCAGHDGMTLRDYFAIRCLPQWFGTGSPDSRAQAAYADADAMLRAREKGPSHE